MKRFLLATIVLVVLGFAKTYGQQEPQFTHYMFDPLMYNPAAAGKDPQFVNITGLYHNQWSSFHDEEGAVAPITQSAEIDAPIHLTSLERKGQYIGVGFDFLSDREGFINTTGFMLSGSYHLPLGPGMFSAGFNAGMVNKAITPDWVTPNPQDQLLPGTSSTYGFDAGLGVWYNTPTYWVGVSALHLPASSLNWSVPYQGNPGSSAAYTVDRTYFLTGGYIYQLPGNPDLELDPSALIKYDQATLSFGLTGILEWKHFLWGGINYRTEKITAASVMAGIQITQNLKVGASYDFATSAPTAFGGTEEFFFNYRFKINLPKENPTWDVDTRFL